MDLYLGASMSVRGESAFRQTHYIDYTPLDTVNQNNNNNDNIEQNRELKENITFRTAITEEPLFVPFFFFDTV